MLRSMFLCIFLFPFMSCDITIPKSGKVIRGTYHSAADTTGGEDTAPVDVSTSTEADGTSVTTPQDVGTSTATDTTSTSLGEDTADSHDTENPVPPTLRVCSTDGECIDEYPNNGFVCDDDGHCTHPSFSCETDIDCPPDKNVCNGIKVCLDRSCYLTENPDCDDGNRWTGDFCSPADGCGHYNIECTDDQGCGEDEYCDTESRRCEPIGACDSPDDCDDGNACTYDRCTLTECSNIPIACADWDPDTMDVCDPTLMCLFTEGCTTNANCVDDDFSTEDVCDDGFCRHICKDGECPP